MHSNFLYCNILFYSTSLTFLKYNHPPSYQVCFCNKKPQNKMRLSCLRSSRSPKSPRSRATDLYTKTQSSPSFYIQINISGCNFLLPKISRIPKKLAGRELLWYHSVLFLSKWIPITIETCLLISSIFGELCCVRSLPFILCFAARDEPLWLYDMKSRRVY